MSKPETQGFSLTLALHHKPCIVFLSGWSAAPHRTSLTLTAARERFPLPKAGPCFDLKCIGCFFKRARQRGGFSGGKRERGWDHSQRPGWISSSARTHTQFYSALVNISNTCSASEQEKSFPFLPIKHQCNKRCNDLNPSSRNPSQLLTCAYSIP